MNKHDMILLINIMIIPFFISKSSLGCQAQTKYNELHAMATEWKITWESILLSDHGNGIKHGKQINTLIISNDKALVQRKCYIYNDDNKPHTQEEDTTNFKETSLNEKTLEIETGIVRQIELIIKKLPENGSTYSMYDFVNDEGSYSEKIVVNIGDKDTIYFLVQGTGAEPISKQLADLLSILQSINNIRM